ncbi:MAG: hypothetical protein HY816_14320 [Candidatus Wallbacteria bacterium]|nr:hypothetical protein [Candidatus Wallbacteria bacterium]
MKIVAIFLGLLLQGVWLVEMAGLVVCSHADGRVLLEAAGALCCDPGCEPGDGNRPAPARAALAAPDACDDRRVSELSPQLPPSRGPQCTPGFRSLGSTAPAGPAHAIAASITARPVTELDVSIAGSSPARLRTVSLRC